MASGNTDLVPRVRPSPQSPYQQQVHRLLFHSNVVHDPRYQNPEFRMSQAQRYFDNMGKSLLSKAERETVNFYCSREISQIIELNGTSKFERCIVNALRKVLSIFSLIFDRVEPQGTNASLRIFGASVFGVGSLLVAAYMNNNKIAGLSMIGVLAVYYKELYLKI